MPGRRDRQNDHIEASLAAQQVLDIVNDVFPHILDVVATGMLACERQHILAAVDVDDRSARLQCLRRHEAVTAEQVQHMNLIEIVTALDALPDPLRTWQIATAQADPSVRIQPAADCLSLHAHAPLARQTAAGWLPVAPDTDIGNINPVGIPVTLAGLTSGQPVRAFHQILAPALQLAPVAEIDQFVVIDRCRHKYIAGIGLGDDG